MYATGMTLLGPKVVILLSASLPFLIASAHAQSALETGIQGFENCSDSRQPSQLSEGEDAMLARFSRRPQPKVIENCQEIVAQNRLPDSASLGELRESARSISPPAPKSSPAPNVSRATPPSVAALHPDKLMPEKLADVAPRVARAQEATLDILAGQNACSAWLTQTNPQIVEIFQSLAYHIEDHGPDFVLRERTDRGDWMDHGPYIARTIQNNGRGAIITINAHGAFFNRIGDIYKSDWPGSLPVRTGAWRAIHVGPYDGGTVRAQIVVLLHEFAHVVGAVPEDDPAKFGLARTQANTEIVLQHCKQDVDLQGKSPKPIVGAGLVN
jgi:hypothetical protein